MLHGNGSVLHKSPARFLAGSTTSAEPQLRAGWGKAGMARNRFFQDMAAVALPKYAIPEGSYAGVAWLIPQKAGAMSSHNNCAVSLAGTGLAVGGITSNGTATLSMVFANAAGQLISSGVGSASMTFSTNTPLLTASLAAVGTASFTLSASAALGAEASASGSASMVFAMAATILPANDASPARTAAASFAITGNLVPYAIGSMVGSTVDTSILTVDAIAAGVLAAALTAPIAANIRKVNDVTVTGTGTVGSEWGPA